MSSVDFYKIKSARSKANVRFLKQCHVNKRKTNFEYASWG